MKTRERSGREPWRTRKTESAEVDRRTACGKAAEVEYHPPSSKNISENLKIGSHKQLS